MWPARCHNLTLIHLLCRHLKINCVGLPILPAQLKNYENIENCIKIITGRQPTGSYRMFERVAAYLEVSG